MSELFDSLSGQSLDFIATTDIINQDNRLVEDVTCAINCTASDPFALTFDFLYRADDAVHTVQWKIGRDIVKLALERQTDYLEGDGDVRTKVLKYGRDDNKTVNFEFESPDGLMDFELDFAELERFMAECDEVVSEEVAHARVDAEIDALLKNQQ